MKKLFLEMVIIISVLFFFTTTVLAENENTTSNTTTSEVSNTTQETKTTETPTETKMNETMYVQERCNIRSSYSVQSDRVGGLDAGTEVTVLAEYSNGWYKIEYDGGQAYIKSGILRSTKPEVEEEGTEETEKEESKDNPTTDQTENTDEVDIEDAELINEIGVLPEVGKNIADYLYIGVVVMAIIGIIYVVKKIN